MYIHVDLSSAPPAVTLEDPDDCTRFHVEVAGAGAGAAATMAAADAVAKAGMGRFADDGDACISVDAVRRDAAGRVGGRWPADFDAMLRYAEAKGWLDETGECIRAHVEWKR